MQITFDIPNQYFSSQSQSQITQQIKLYTALLMFQSGQLSRGAACELAGINFYEFLNACQQFNIRIINSSAQDVENEVLRFEQRQQNDNC